MKLGPLFANILIVDDDLLLVRTLRTVLHAAGYIVRSVDSGEAGLEAVYARPPDLILLDVKLSRTDGYEVARRLKADNNLPFIPIIIMGDAPHKAALSLNAGADDFLHKPFDNAELLMHIRARADELGVDKVPAIAVIGAEDYGVRLYGIPAGYEFTSFVHAIRSVAAGTTDLGAEVEAELAQIAEPLHLQVFVTPTCPYCPQAVVMAHQMAIASPYIRADMIEATEFPELSMKYQVMGVPRTVINETVHIEGAAPLGMMMDRIREALQHGGEAAA